MQALVERIRHEGRNLGRGILKVDGFINHQFDPELTLEMGRSFARRFADAGVSGVTKIITAEVSGIAPALTTAIVLGVPVIYARKTRPITMPDGFLRASAPSHTKGGISRPDCLAGVSGAQRPCAADRRFPGQRQNDQCAGVTGDAVRTPRSAASAAWWRRFSSTDACSWRTWMCQSSRWR
jgi:hypothetical protein